MSDLSGPEGQEAIYKELQALRGEVQATNRILSHHGVKVHVFWKIAWGIIMAQILLVLLILLVGMTFGLMGLLGVTGAAQQQNAEERYRQLMQESMAPASPTP